MAGGVLGGLKKQDMTFHDWKEYKKRVSAKKGGPCMLLGHWISVAKTPAGCMGFMGFNRGNGVYMNQFSSPSRVSTLETHSIHTLNV